MSSNVNGLDGFKNQSAASANGNTRAEVILVKKGENIAIIAKRFGMSKEEFIKWTGLKGINERVGQKIKLPTAKIEKGKGIYALARKYNMTMDEFCKLNNIKDRQNYQAKAGEVFYVKNNNKKSIKISKNPAKSSKSDVKPSSAAAGGAIIGNVVGKLVENKNKWNSSYSPDEIANKLYEIADNSWGAVGRPDFDALIKEINPKNVSEVLDSYKKLKSNKDKNSLIYTIADETASKANARKNAIMHIYNALAKAKGESDKTAKYFKKELDDQFDKFFGKVDTKMLDNTLNSLLAKPTIIDKPEYNITFDRNKNNKVTDNKAVKIGKETRTVAQLRKGAIKGSASGIYTKFMKYCSAHKMQYDPSLLDMSPLQRIPNPVIDNEGNIVPYISKLQKPTAKPNGKVVILNSGHGGYNRLSGGFDVGSYSFVKKANGKYAPHFEYEKVQPYVSEMANKLRANGYAVIITQGEMHSFTRTKELTNIVNKLGKGKGSDNTVYSKNDVAFISFHADSSDKIVDENDRSSACYDPSFDKNRVLAKVINDSLNNYPNTWVKSDIAQRTKYIDKNGKEKSNRVGTLVECSAQKIPSVLLETAHINGAKGRANLDSSKFREQFIDSTILGLNQYFGLN